MTVVGLGGQDSLGQALDFVEDYGTKSFRMLYDDSFQSWAALGVRGQPIAIMFDTAGTGRFIWYGPFDEQEVLQAAAEL